MTTGGGLDTRGEGKKRGQWEMKTDGVVGYVAEESSVGARERLRRAGTEGTILEKERQ